MSLTRTNASCLCVQSVSLFNFRFYCNISRTIRRNWRFGQSLFEHLSLRGFAVWIVWPTRISDWKFLKTNTVHYTMLCCLTLLYTLLETPACRGVILVVGTEEWALALNSDQPHFFSLVTFFYSFFFSFHSFSSFFSWILSRNSSISFFL